MPVGTTFPLPQGSSGHVLSGDFGNDPAKVLCLPLFADLEHFIWGTPVVKSELCLDAPILWRSTNLRRAGTVPLGADAHGLIRWMADLNTATGRHTRSAGSSASSAAIASKFWR